MSIFPLFSSSPSTAYLLLVMRAIEFVLLCYYMNSTELKLSRTRSITVLFLAFIMYSAIYEARTYANSLYSILIIHLLHLLIWGYTIFLLYRPTFSKLCTINLLFFLLTRASRWMFNTLLRASRSGSIAFISVLSENYLYTWIPNLLLEIFLVVLAKRSLPQENIPGDSRSNISLSLLTILFLYARYNINDQVLANTNYFELSTITMVYLFIIIMTFVIIGLSIMRQKHFEQEKILLLNESRYRNSLNRMEADNCIRRIYHDINKHLNCISAVAKDNEKVTEYINSIQGELAKSSLLINTGNEFLDSVLSDYLQLAAQNDVQIICDVDMRNADFLDAIDICSIFGNALENAYEAVINVPEPNKRLITIKARPIDSFLVIRISNYYNQPPAIINGRLTTTKEDKYLHGIGLNSIEHTVKKNHGSMNIQLDRSEIFVLKILLPIP